MTGNTSESSSNRCDSKNQNGGDNTESFCEESTNVYTRKSENLRRRIHKENFQQYSQCSKLKNSDNVKKKKDIRKRRVNKI